jgi:hypothetical protein
MGHESFHDAASRSSNKAQQPSRHHRHRDSRTTTTTTRICIVFALILLLAMNHYGNSASVKAVQASLAHRSSFDNVTTLAVQGLTLLHTNHKPRNLVAFTALGTPTAIATVHHNIMRHFAHDDDWTCMLFMYVNESHIAADEPRILELSQHCSVVRVPGLKWAHFLLSLTPAVVQHFDHIALVLDDVFAPNEGPSPVIVPMLLERMKRHNLSSISPAIKGGFWPSSHPPHKPQDACLQRVNVLETFFQIFTRKHWNCYHSYLHHANPQAFCMDLCMQNLCPGVFAIDGSMVAYHLGRQYWVDRFVPNESLGSAKLAFGMRRDYPQGVVDHWDVCDKYNCSKEKDFAGWSAAIECGIWNKASRHIRL